MRMLKFEWAYIDIICAPKVFFEYSTKQQLKYLEILKVHFKFN